MRGRSDGKRLHKTKKKKEKVNKEVSRQEMMTTSTPSVKETVQVKRSKRLNSHKSQ